MAVVRLREHSRQVRVNVDVVVEGRRAQRRWLATTPDTYRVRSRETFGPAPPPDHLVVLGPASEDLLRPLADPALDAALLAVAEPPGLVARRRTEPEVAPLAAAVRREAWEEVEGAPAGDLVGLYERLRQAGRHLALIPVSDPRPPLPGTGRGPGGGVPPGRERSRRHDPVQAPGSAVVLALVPLHDVGGGSRGAQLALELLARGYHVTYLALFGTAESEDLGIRFVHPNLEEVRADRFDPDHLASRLRTPNRLAILEAPHPAYLAVVEGLRRHGYRLVYDLIDDWSAPSLGGRWYQPEVEHRVVDLADALVASAPSLVERLEGLSGREVTLVPNAVNARLFSGEPGPAPTDLPGGEGPLFGYHGSLYGDWFDWEALRAVAERFPEARVVVIGDHRGDHPAVPANVRFLGLKAQTELPAYLSRLEVGLLPFSVTEVTHAVSPLKVYEYLACGVPVAAPPLRSLEGLEGVVTAHGLPEAVEMALVGPRPDPEPVRERHSWGTRVEDLVRALGLTPVREDGGDVRIVLRPPVHYSRGERRVEGSG